MSYTASDTVVKSEGGTLSRTVQDMLVGQVRAVLREAPLVRPLSANGAEMRVMVSNAGKRGWRGDGDGYAYQETRTDGEPWPEMPRLWKEIAWAALRVAPGADDAPDFDCAVINWYAPDAALGWHQDKAEKDRTKPIVTISLGDSASWAVKSAEDSKPTRCVIRSGDITILQGPTRPYFHTIERVIPEPLFSPLTKRGRISITLRVAG